MLLWSEWIDKMFGRRRVFSEGPKFFELCPIVLNYVQNIFTRGAKIFLEPPIYGHAYLGTNCALVPTPSSPDKAISAILGKSPLHKGKR